MRELETEERGWTFSSVLGHKVTDGSIVKVTITPEPLASLPRGKFISTYATPMNETFGKKQGEYKSFFSRFKK